MNRFRLLLAVFVVGLVSPLLAQTKVELSGVLVTPAKTSLQLTDLATGRTAWLVVGQTFAGYTISSYDPKTETAALTKSGATTQVRLKSSRVQPTKTLTPEEAQQINKAVYNNLRQVGAAADRYFLKHDKTSVTLTELVGPEKYIKELYPVDGENYETLELKQGSELKVTTAHGAVVVYKP